MVLVGLRKTSFAIFWFIIFWILGLIAINIFLNATNTSDTSSRNSYQQGYLKGQEAGKKVRVPLTVITGLLAITGSITGILPETKTSKKIKEIEPEPEILSPEIEEK